MSRQTNRDKNEVSQNFKYVIVSRAVKKECIEKKKTS